MANEAVRGRFVWHDLLSPDPQAASKFYNKVVGWTSEKWDKDPNYTLFKFGDRQLAGVMAPPKDVPASGGPPTWITHIGTPDVDATARLAVELGGTVKRPPTDIPEVGRFAILMDPQGATFAVFTPSRRPAGAPPAPGVGDFSWHELVTSDWQKAFDFYQKLFGWKKTSAMEMGGDMGTYQMFGWDQNSQGGMFNKPANQPGPPPMWLPYALVPDAKGAVAAINAGGGKVINGPMEVPGGDWIVQGIDPQGAMFALHSRKPAVAKPVARRASPGRVKAAAKAKPKRATKAPAAKSRKKTAAAARRGKQARAAQRGTAGRARVARASRKTAKRGRRR